MAPNYSPIFADPAAEQEISLQGYTIMPLLGPDEVDRLTQLYVDTVPNLPADFYSTAFLPDCPERRAMTDGVQAVLEPHIAALMPSYRVHSRGYIVKRGGPGQPSLRLHQDYSYVDQDVHRAVHLWIPLVDVDRSNGCLTAVPRTHHLVNHLSAMVNNPSPYDPVRPVLDAECTVMLPMRAGEAAFFDQRLYHGSTPNAHEGIRVALACALLPRDVTQRLYVVDEEDIRKLNVLEIRDEFTVRYSRGVKIIPPYPDGVTKVGTIAYQAEALSDEKLNSLKLERPMKAEPAATERPSFLSRLFGQR